MLGLPRQSYGYHTALVCSKHGIDAVLIRYYCGIEREKVEKEEIRKLRMGEKLKGSDFFRILDILEKVSKKIQDYG